MDVQNVKITFIKCYFDILSGLLLLRIEFWKFSYVFFRRKSRLPFAQWEKSVNNKSEGYLKVVPEYTVLIDNVIILVGFAHD